MIGSSNFAADVATPSNFAEELTERILEKATGSSVEIGCGNRLAIFLSSRKTCPQVLTIRCDRFVYDIGRPSAQDIL